MATPIPRNEDELDPMVTPCAPIIQNLQKGISKREKDDNVVY